VHNSGASFGIGAGHPLVITLTAAVVLALALVLLARTRSRAVALSLGAVAGGAAGNLADRLLRGPGLGSGSVVDWIHVAIYPATFNLADVAIRLGALCALIAYLRAATPVPRLGGTAGAQRLRALTGRLPRHCASCECTLNDLTASMLRLTAVRAKHRPYRYTAQRTLFGRCGRRERDR
jgi:signal peptidase II